MSAARQTFMRLASSPAIKSPTTPRSILKRPTPLPLSPSAMNIQFASFSVHVSPTVTSPHVHFPNSAKLTSTFMTHSPNTYDRASIVVSPNPLAMPAYGDRVFSPISGVFKNSQNVEVASPSPLPKTVEVAELNLELPQVAKPAKVKQTRASVKFQQKLATKQPTPLPRDDLPSALLKYPRSPYPTAPMSPAGKENTVAPEVNSAKVTRGTKQRPAKAEQTIQMSASAEEKLSQEFWKSVTLEGVPNPSTPTFMFGTQDGGLWSPGLPPAMRGGATESVGLSSVLSPFSRTTFANHVNPQAILSPTPNDTLSSFPSFSQVLTGNPGITYPPKAIVQL